MSASALFLAAILTAAPDAPIALDAKHQLFLDDYLIASKEGVTREIHPVTKYAGNPVLKPTEPWEGNMAIVYGSVIREQDKYRIWYLTPTGVGYAESADGIAWTKPRLDIVRFEGQETNLVVDRKGAVGAPGVIPYFYEMFGVFRDDRDPDPARRYKMAFLSIHRKYRGPHEDPFHRGQRRGIGVAASPDGLHWKLLENWATQAICDGASHFMVDAAQQKYVFYGRTKYTAPEVAEKNAGDSWCKKHYWGRAVTRVESQDFLHWNITAPGKSPVVMAADAQDPVGTEIYSMLVFPYESVYIGLVQMFYIREDAYYLDIQLAVSRDGVQFTRVGDRQPFIPVGPQGSWDRFNNSLATNPPLTVGDELRFYYGGRTYRHTPYKGPDPGTPGGCVGLGTIKRDRFASLNAGKKAGEIVTRPVRLASGKLHLNAQADGGCITVVALDSQGKTIVQSKPISADGLDIPVVWEQDKQPPTDTPITLRIALQNAKLFSLWCD